MGLNSWQSLRVASCCAGPGCGRPVPRPCADDVNDAGPGRVPVTRSQRLDERGAVRGAQSDHRVVAGWGYLEGSTIRAGVRLGGPGRPFWVSLAGRSGRAVLVLGPRGSLELDRGPIVARTCRVLAQRAT